MINSNTKFQEFSLGNITQEWHEDGQTRELVIINTWVVKAGDEGDVEKEWEEVLRYPPLGCMFAKVNMDRNQPMNDKQIADIKKLHSEFYE